ncbi:MAG: sigma 54-interacting transcriptional regulator, partial [Deltaproteobacteria bacterium]|nr:sigma 54-interacting transcriptional regulator [Deltaproteobacteria bacterium]
KVATTDVPVLITGESGTGKELIARAVHSMGMRQKMPLVPINCGAIPENLMESELFGHEKGAFTGAHMQRQGKFELAQGGTLFLDEIGELPLSLQVKLLRFLQDHKIERVGGRETLAVDVRIIAATNRNIKKLVEDGAFREDLYYRLAVVTIDLPALRDRGDDMVLLAKAFIERYADGKKGIKTLSYESVDAVMSYNWPGNVRELENRIRRAMTFSEGPALTPRDLGLEEKIDAEKEPHQPLTLRMAKDELEKKLINEAVSRNSGNISKAADELGLTRPTLYTLMKKYQLTSKS